MSANVINPTIEFPVATKPNGNLQQKTRSLFVLCHLDRFANQSAEIVREMFPSRLKMLPQGVVTMTDVSRARGHGGPLSRVAAYFMAMKLTGQPRTAADRAMIWLEGIIDWLYSMSTDIPSDAEIRAASVAEQDAEHRENLSQLLLASEINKDTLEQAISAIEAEEARMRELKLLLRRRLAAER
jgi:hypothetical protein